MTLDTGQTEDSELNDYIFNPHLLLTKVDDVLHIAVISVVDYSFVDVFTDFANCLAKQRDVWSGLKHMESDPVSRGSNIILWQLHYIPSRGHSLSPILLVILQNSSISSAWTATLTDTYCSVLFFNSILDEGVRRGDVSDLLREGESHNTSHRLDQEDDCETDWELK